MKKYIYSIMILALTANYLYGQNNYDIVVVGAFVLGIAAAINAADEGMKVALIQDNNHIGCHNTAGISYMDFKCFETLGGTWREFMNRIESYCVETYGANSNQVQTCWNGAYYEPIVAKKVLWEMLDEQFNNIEIQLNHRLV